MFHGTFFINQRLQKSLQDVSNYSIALCTLLTPPKSELHKWTQERRSMMSQIGVEKKVTILSFMVQDSNSHIWCSGYFPHILNQNESHSSIWRTMKEEKLSILWAHVQEEKSNKQKDIQRKPLTSARMSNTVCPNTSDACWLFITSDTADWAAGLGGGCYWHYAQDKNGFHFWQKSDPSFFFYATPNMDKRLPPPPPPGVQKYYSRKKQDPLFPSCTSEWGWWGTKITLHRSRAQQLLERWI